MSEYFSQLENIQVHFMGENYGWGKAVNQGLVFFKNGNMSEYILISNNDVIYHDGWYEKCLQAYEKHPDTGILGVWKHTAHSTIAVDGEYVIRDQMPAVGWLMKRAVIDSVGAFPEHGPCPTKGGNGEDTEYCVRVQQKGYLVAGLKDDVATHIDGY